MPNLTSMTFLMEWTSTIFAAAADDVDNDEEDSLEREDDVYKLLSFVCSMAMISCSLAGLAGNAVAVRHFSRPPLRSSVNVLLTALSAFDLTLLATGTPLYSLMGIYSYLRQRWSLLALSYCMLVFYPVSTMAQMGSVWTMTLLSLERYCGVCHPFVARRHLTVGRAKFGVCCVAVVCLLYNLCRFWEYSLSDEGLPTPLLRNNSLYLQTYVHWMYFTFVFSLPFLVIVVFNGLVMVGVREAMLNRPRCQMSVQQRGERRTTLMLLVVVGVFLVCNSLAWLLNAYEMLGFEQSLSSFEFLSDLNNLLVLAHPLFNILVYAGCSSNFRRELYRTIRRQPRLLRVYNPNLKPAWDSVEAVRRASSGPGRVQPSERSQLLDDHQQQKQQQKQQQSQRRPPPKPPLPARNSDQTRGSSIRTGNSETTISGICDSENQHFYRKPSW